MRANHDALAALRETAQPLHGTSDDYDHLLKLIGEAQFVLIGEATHGTSFTASAPR